MSVFSIDTLLKSPPAPLCERGENRCAESKGSSHYQREDRGDLATLEQPNTQGISA